MRRKTERIGENGMQRSRLNIEGIECVSGMAGVRVGTWNRTNIERIKAASGRTDVREGIWNQIDMEGTGGVSGMAGVQEGTGIMEHGALGNWTDLEIKNRTGGKILGKTSGKMSGQIPPILEVKDLSVSFHMYDTGLEQYDLKVISDLSLDVHPGEIVAIAGSSGSGKSLLAHAVMGLLPGNASLKGEIFYKGELLDQNAKERLRGKEMALVPQSVAYLDPLLRVKNQVRGAKPDEALIEARKEIFRRLNLNEHTEQLYPFQLSGGMARRVLVSTAVVSGAELIIADEPTPGLDLDMAVEALKIFRELADEGKAVVLITHDIDLAFNVADRIAVFYAGTTVEVAEASDFRKGPEALRHPYSRALWRALPQNGFQPIPGFQPYAKYLPEGCLFAPRCHHKTADCEKEIPMRELRGGYVRCIHAD